MGEIEQMLYVVIWHPKGKRPETYSQWGREDAQSLIDFYEFAESETTVFDGDGNKVTSEFSFEK